jgi:hypothetical protein
MTLLGQNLMSEARNVPSPPNHGHAICVIGLRRGQINPKPSIGTYFRDPRVPQLTLSLRGYTSFANFQTVPVSCKAIQPD